MREIDQWESLMQANCLHVKDEKVQVHFGLQPEKNTLLQVVILSEAKDPVVEALNR